MSSPTYRPEDELREKGNALRLKELFRDEDYRGLLDLALVLNFEACSNHSKMHWALQEAAKNMSEEFSIDKYKKMIEDLA